MRDWLGEEASEELRQRAGGSRIAEMFDLPSELLSGQLGAIADQAMEEQGNTPVPTILIQKMASRADPLGRTESLNEASGEDKSLGATRALAIQRNLDQFQISVSASWRRYLIGTSIVLSFGLFVFGIRQFGFGSFVSALEAPHNRREWVMNFLVLSAVGVTTGSFAGFLGAIARDLVAIIEKLRR